MELETGHYVQLIIALLASVGFFIAIYSLPSKYVLGAFFLLIPFQPIDSQFGSINVVLAHAIFIAYSLQKRVKYFPLFGPVMLIFGAYAASFAFAPRDTWSDHLIYLFSFVTNFMVFYLAYNYARKSPDWRYFRNIVIWINVLILIYCTLQMLAPDRLAVPGLSELAIGRTRATRLVGPFNATAATADALVLISLVLLYAYSLGREILSRRLYLGLLCVNSLFILATGNRGGFLLLLLAGAMFLWSFRIELGKAQALKIVVGAVLGLTIASILVLNFTRFNVLYERLTETEFEGMVPDTRTGVWLESWEAISQAPITGYGPELRLGPPETVVAGIVQIRYPHSLPLYVLYTTGVIGLIAFAVFFGTLGIRLWRTRVPKTANGFDAALAGVPRLIILMFAIFCLSQIRIEFFRFELSDYQHLIFMLFGILLGFCDHISRTDTVSAPQKVLDTWKVADDEPWQHDS